jgi:hypothetical protein
MSSTESPPDLPYPKLPFWDSVSLSYATYFGNLAAVLRASWLWLVMAAALTALVSWQQWSWMSGVITNLRPGQPPQAPKPGELMLLLYASNLLLLLAGVSIAVAWHRLMILNERPGVSGSNVATGNLWRYIGIGIAIFVIGFLPAAIVMFLSFAFLFPPHTSGSPSPGSFAIIPLIFVLYAIGFAVTMRLSLLLPAQATGNRDLTLKQAWRQTSGNTWRLIWGIAFTTLPPLLVAQIAFVTVIGIPNPANLGGGDFVLRMTVLSTVTMVYYLLALPIGIGFLSHAYRHFFQAPLGTQNR